MPLMMILFIAFIVKHFICDFPLQRWSYMYLNKGKYGHPGGLLHAFIQGYGTMCIVFFVDRHDVALLFWIDAIIHYHVDYAKVKLCTVFNLKPDNSEWYWHLLGLDQMLHYLTYVLLIYLMIGN